jgi:hypothetical protein
MPRLLAFAFVALLALPAPLAARQATPVAGGARLFAAGVPQEALPGEAGPVYVARAVYGPGEGEALPPDNGLTVLAVVAGALVLEPEGPATLVGGGRPDGGGPAAGPAELAAGAGALLPAGSGGGVENRGAEPAVAVWVALYPAEGYVPAEPHGAEAPGGELGWELLGKGSPQDPPVASDLAVERVPLASGAALAMDEAGIAVAYVEAGTVAVAVEAGLAEASSGAFLRTRAVGPGAALLGPGQGRRVREGGSLFVQPGTRLELANEGDEPAELLVVRLAPTAAGAGATPLPA